MKKLTLAAVAILSAFTFANASPLTSNNLGPGSIVINFDNLTGGTSLTTGDVVTNQYAGLGVTINDGVQNALANASVSGLFSGHSQPNVLFVEQNFSVTAAPLQILFASPVSEVALFFSTSLSADLFLTAYDASNTVIESDDFIGISNSIGRAGEAGIAAPGISRLDLSSNGGSFNFEIDDLTFIPAASSSVTTPEPATLLLVGSGIAAALSRRRRKD